MEELIGTIKLFAGSYCPREYMYCNGQELPVNNYQTLLSIVGFQYGGNGRTTFKLPNLNEGREGDVPKYIICVNGIYPQRD